MYFNARTEQGREDIAWIRARDGMCCWECKRWIGIRQDGYSFKHVPLIHD